MRFSLTTWHYVTYLKAIDCKDQYGQAGIVTPPVITTLRKLWQEE
jgi:hypothetical protein